MSLNPTLQLSEEQHAFLAAYRELGNLTLAARAVKVPLQQHYDWMANALYSAEFEDAKEQAADLLVAEAARRAVQGWEEPVVRRGKPVHQVDSRGRKTNKAVTVRKFDSKLLTLLIKGARPEIYRDNFKGEIPVRKSRRVDYSRLTDAEFDQLHALTRKAMPEFD